MSHPRELQGASSAANIETNHHWSQSIWALNASVSSVHRAQGFACFFHLFVRIFPALSLSAQPSILSSHRQEWQVRNIPEHPRTFFLRNAFWTFLPRDSLKMAWHESHVRVTTWLFVWIFLLFYFMSIRKLRNMYLGQNSATNYNDVESMHSASRRLWTTIVFTSHAQCLYLYTPGSCEGIRVG